jgi:lactoylglutathione lyase
MTALLRSASIGAITLFTADLDRSRSFYQDVFGLPVTFEDQDSAVFRFENTLINVLRIAAADELVAPAAVAAPDAGPGFVLTIGVDDVDSVCAELSRRGVELLNGPMDRPWGVRTASFMDPGGHVWEVAQDLPRARRDSNPQPSDP